jgi:dihydroneopterin aldolase
MTIHIEKLKISAIIGILDFERIKTQTVIVDARIEYEYQENQFINYAEVISIIETMIISKEYQLLEDALSDIQQKIVRRYSQINKLHLKISKPNIIKNATVALSVEYFREN